MFKRTKLSTAAVMALGGLTTIVALPVTAQETQRIEIVGSNIKRITSETALPVTIIGREEIQRSGATTVQELLRGLGVSGGQSFESQGAASFVTGTSAVGLRGLSAGDTLVLLNGRRIAPYADAQQSGTDGAISFVDLNSLPLSAVQQIQILKDGASAIYGADAIAGVINVVTRKDYTGLELQMRAGFYPAKDNGREVKGGITAGFGDLAKNRYNFLVSFEAAKTDRINYADRAESRNFDHRAQAPYLGDQRSSFSDYGNYDVGAGYRAGTNCPGYPTAGNGTDINNLFRAGACRYNFGVVETLQPEVDRVSFLSVGQFAISPTTTLFGELGLNRNKVSGSTRAPAMDTATDFFQVDAARGLPLGTTRDLVSAALATQVPAGLLQPGQVLGSNIYVRTRFTNDGPRPDNITNTNYRVLGGLRGTYGNWDWETAITQTASKNKSIDSNEINKALLADLMVAGQVNLWGINKSGYQSAKYVGKSEGELKLQMWDGKLSGEVFKLGGGAAMMAVGAEYRKETIASTSDPVSALGLKLGSASTGTDGSRDLKSFFAELSMPVTKELEATLAARHERYSDFGSTTNPKFAVRYQPNKTLLLRASYGSSFKAPTLFQLYEAQAAGGYEELIDTIRCPITGTPDDCDGRLIESRSGGAILNGINLQPEESKNLNVGFVIEPIDGLNFSMDYWRIKKTNAITQNAAQAAIDNPNSPLVIRNPTVGGVPGTIIRVIQSYFNANRQNVEGIDVEGTLRWASGPTRYTLAGSATYLRKFDQFSDGCDPCSLVGNYDGSGANPRVKGTATLRIENGPWNWSAQGNFLGGFKFVSGARAAGASVDQPRVEEHMSFDTQLAYTGFKNLELRLGVRNLFDDAPRLMAFFPAGYDTSLYDGRGRFAWFAMNYTFK